jgi:POT family proton-dependent oligopeptide transporter
MILPPERDVRQIFGHPRGLAILFSTEMWERFSYYGMRALLMLYMVDHLLRPERLDFPIGLSELKSLLENFFGPLDIQPLASQIYGLYTSLVYLTPILGGYIADRWLGRTKTIVIGAMLMVFGHFLMANEYYFLPALLLLILGVGAFKPNISTQVGELYAPHDRRRDRAFSIFYVGINIGACLAPLIAGTLGERMGWHYGFACAGIGMTIGLAIYLWGLVDLPESGQLTVQRRFSKEEKTILDDAYVEHGRQWLIMLFVPSVLFWAAFEQQGNTIVLWAENFTDRNISFFGRDFEIPITWFQALNPLMIFLFTPVLVSLWNRMALFDREPQTIDKLTAGCFGVAFSYLVMTFAAWTSEAARVSPLWLLLYFGLITVSELLFSPIILSLASSIAPSGSRGVTMGVWFLTIFFGNLLSGWLGGFWSTLSPAAFFAVVGAMAAIGGFMILFCRLWQDDALD